jgi:tetratricopeptide (TPR) repeat protein
MNTKKWASVVLAVVCSLGAFAGSNERGIDLFRAQLYDAAKIFFLEQTGQSPVEQAENAYYLGQTYYALQQSELAAEQYAKAVTVAPEYPFGYVGQGRVALAKNDLKGAESLFKTAAGLVKKDASVQTAIAEAYIAAKLYPQADAAIEKARKIDKKYSGIYQAEGDKLMQEGKKDQAYSSYENARAFNDKDKVSYLKLAKAYEFTNPTVALEYLDKLLAIDKEYIPAYALIGDINYEKGVYGPAIEAYEKFISIPGVPIDQHERYAYSLYFTDQYEKSLKQIDYALSKNPNNSVMYRIMAYNNFKLENSDLAVKQIAKFLQDNPEDKHIYLDYITYGRALIKEKQPEVAIAALLKAEKLDPNKAEVHQELAEAYAGVENFLAANEQYEKYIQSKDAESLEALDYLNYGLNNYSAASKYLDVDYKSDVDFQTYVTTGDQAFAKIVELAPNSHMGYLWQANINSLVDIRDQIATGEMKGAAKPYFEKLLEFSLAHNEEGKRNTEIITAYDYLASYYYFTAKDQATAVEYYKKILAIDPTNEKALSVLKQLNIK